MPKGPSYCARLKYKESVVFGHSGDEIVIRRLIPWGHYNVGAKNFRALEGCIFFKIRAAGGGKNRPLAW